MANVVAIRFDQSQEVREVVAEDVGMDEFVAGAVHQADVHLSCMQIDSAVELSGGRVIFHRSFSSFLVMVLRERVPVDTATVVASAVRSRWARCTLALGEVSPQRGGKLAGDSQRYNAHPFQRWQYQ